MIGQKIMVKGSLGRSKEFAKEGTIEKAYSNLFVVKYEEGEYNLYRFTQDENGNLATEIMHEGYKKYEDIQIVSLR